MAHQYELVREIFNKCSGNQMRDVFVSEVESDNLDEYVKQYLVGGDIHFEKTISENGVIIFDLEIDGLKERLAFTPE
jgi:hypothetical protein